MDKGKNFEIKLPENYVLVKHVDAKSDKRLVLIYSLLSFVPVVVIAPLLCVIAVFVSGYSFGERLVEDGSVFVVLILCASMILYVVLHELVHGITYKFFTGGKLTFGLTLTVAFCGVPDLYVRKKASVAALVMPFAVFSVILAGLTVGMWFICPLYGVAAGILFSIHAGGCVGDLHWILTYLTKFRRCNTLMRDTGPEQWLYIPEEEAEKFKITPINVRQDAVS